MKIIIYKIMFNFLSALCLLVYLSSCTHQPQSVNSTSETLQVMPVVAGQYAANSSQQVTPDGEHATPGSVLKNAGAENLRRAPKSSIQGQVVQGGQIPLPVPRAQLELFIKKNNQWISISKLTAENNGHFQFTQNLKSGTYIVRLIENKLLEGEKIIHLQNEPATGLVFEVHSKK